MNFDFTEEQQMIRDSIARFVQDDYDWETRKAIVASDKGMSDSAWQQFAELGWLSIPFDEAVGGFGGSIVDTAVIMEEIGKGLIVEPYLATVLLYGNLIAKAGDEAQRGALIPSIIDGSTLGTFAYVERQSRFEITDCKTSAQKAGERYSISGEKVVVLNAANAHKAVVLARTSGEQFDREGLSLFVVDLEAEEVERFDYAMMDGQRRANLTFTNTPGELLGQEGKAMDTVDAVIREATIAIAAEALGCMGVLNTKTLEYTKQREQFDVSISSFQALKHRMVDTMMAFEQTKSLLYRAMCEFQEDLVKADVTVHALKVLLDRNAKLVYGEAIQLHGGMGITDELDIGHYAKRLMMINTTFGDVTYHRNHYANKSYAA